MQLTLHPKQSQVFQSPARQILFGGAAGPGKSHLLRVAAIAWAYAIPGLQVYLFRRTFPDLYKNHMEGPTSFPMLLAPWIAEGFVKTNYGQHQFAFAHGSKIHLMHMQYEHDTDKIQGAEIHVALIDELTHFTKNQYSFIRSRVRMSGLDIPPEFMGRFPRIVTASNPGGPGHQWVRALFVDSASPGTIWDAPVEEGGLTTQFIPALLRDNPTLLRDDPTYGDRLRGLSSPELVRAMLEGDWNAMVGGMLDDVFDVRWHVVEPFPIPQGWAVRRAFDWGSSKPFAVGWFAHSDGESATPQGRVYPKGTRFLVAEYYGWNGKPNEGLRLTNTEIARHIRGIEDEGPYAGRVRPGPADTQIFDVVNGTSIADEMAREGIRWEAAQKGPGSRRQGAMLLRQRLKASRRWPLEEPGLFVFATCRQWLRTVPVVPRDPKNPDDVDCFVAGTLIDTPQGQVPIEDLVVHDYVHTPIGPRQILKAGVAGIVPTYTVICADGATLEGTFDHKIYVENRGLLPLCRVSLGDTLITRDELWTFEQSYMPMWSSGSIQDDDILSADQVPPSHWDQVSCSGWSGCESRGLSPTAMMSTTKIMTPPITTLRTWNSDLRVSMGDTISKSALRPVVISRQRLQHGVTQMLGRQPFATMLARCVQRLPSENLRALIVATLFERSILAKNTVPMPVKRPLLVKGASPSCALSVAPRRWSKAMAPGRRRPVVTSVVGSFASKPVYYLTIEQAHLFYANGILSANSDSEDHMYDCTRYELSMPPLQPARAMVLHL